jgi:hypothetical protein
MGSGVLQGGSMSEKGVSKEYANSVIFDLEKAFWDERGKGARFRVTTIGRDYLRDKCLPQIKSKSLEDIIETIGWILPEEGIAEKLSYERDEQLLHLQVQGCLHQSVEKKMLKYGIEPFTCIPANILVLAIEEILGRQVELSEVRIENGICKLLLVIFEKRPGA